MENDSNIRYRVVTGVTTTRGDPPFVRLTQAFLALSNSLEGGQSDLQIWLFRALCNEVLNTESQVRRHHAIQGACAREIERYATKQSEIESAISAAAAEIEQAKTTLQEAQTLRANLEEYERKKESLMQYASRSASAAEQQRVLDDVAAVQADRNQADGMLQLRGKQFGTLLHVLEILQEAISEGPSLGVAS